MVLRTRSPSKFFINFSIGKVKNSNSSNGDPQINSAPPQHIIHAMPPGAGITVLHVCTVFAVIELRGN